MRLLVDMNLTRRWVEFLRQHSIESKHWSDVGEFDAGDPEIFSYARQHDFVVFTHDLDFSALLAQGRANKPSVIQIRHPKPRPQDCGPQVVQAIRAAAAELATGALLSVEPGRHRVRILPISNKSVS